MKHALRAAIECFFESRCSPRNLTLETIRELEFDVDDWIGGELEAALLWVKMLVVTTESLDIQNQKTPHGEEGKGLFLAKDAA